MIKGFSFLSPLFSKKEQKNFGSASFINTYNNKHAPQIIDKSQRLNEYRGWIQGIITLIAQNIAQVDLDLYADQIDANNKIVNFRTIRRKAYSQDTSVKIEDHPAEELLETASNYMDGFSLMQLTQTLIDLFGNCYWWVEKINNVPSAIHILDTQKVSILTNEAQTKIVGYVYKQDGKDPITFMPEEIVNFCANTPFSRFYGDSPLRGLALANSKMDLGSKLEYQILKNNGVPLVLLTCETTLSPSDIRIIEEQFGKSQKGNSGGVKVLDKRFTLDTIDVDISKLMVNEQQQWDLKQIAFNFGVPYALIDTTNQLKAGLDETFKLFNQNCLKPRLKKIEQALNSQYLPMWTDDSTVYFEYEDIDPENEKQDADIMVAYVSGKILTPNEARAELGYPPIEGGDVLQQAPKPFQTNPQEPIKG
jgi:HK97 family phage portal protein